VLSWQGQSKSPIENRLSLTTLICFGKRSLFRPSKVQARLRVDWRGGYSLHTSTKVTSTQSIESPRRRWRIAWLLGLGVLVNYFDRVNLSVSHAALFTAFGLTNFGFGILSGAYNWTYAACQLPIGVLLDRFGIRRIGRISTFIWSLASFGAALSPGLGSFFGARLLLGVGEAPTFPANAKAIGHWFPASERGFATSLNDAAAKFASAIGVPLIGVVLLKVGWRWSFAATGFVSLAYFFLFWHVYREPGEDPKLGAAERAYIAEGAAPSPTATVESASLGYLIRQRKVLGLALGFGSYNYVFYLLLTWLPSYLASALHIDLLHSFLYTGVPWLFATVTDLSGGWLADHLIRRGYDASRVRKVFLVCGLACGLGILGAANAHTATRALIWISISLGGLAAAAPVGWSVPSMIAPRGSVGTVGGIVNFSNQISGIAAPFLTGWIVSVTHAYAWAFVVAAIYLLLGIASYIFLLGRIEPIRSEGHQAA
jgi:ACS family D-galactonate transporter-like MFS transporter